MRGELSWAHMGILLLQMLVYLSMCSSQGCAVQKRLKYSMPFGGLSHVGARNHVLDGVKPRWIHLQW